MWSAAYGLIALAVVAFVVHYAALHTPDLASVNLADQLYRAKKWLADSLTSLPRTDRNIHFAVSSGNIVKVRVVNVAASGRSFPVQLPIGYKLTKSGGNLLYELYLNVTSCKPTALQGGAAATLYAVELRHSLDQLPWLEVYAAVPRNPSQYYSWLYNYYAAWGRPPAVGLDPRVGADADAGLVDYVKAEWAARPQRHQRRNDALRRRAAVCAVHTGCGLPPRSPTGLSLALARCCRNLRFFPRSPLATMSRLLLAIAVLLLLATVAAAGATLTCTVESSYTVDTTDDISVSFDFTSIAPVFPDKGIRFADNLIYSPV
jgi:hypothetical protein